MHDLNIFYVHNESGDLAQRHQAVGCGVHVHAGFSVATYEFKLCVRNVEKDGSIVFPFGELFSLGAKIFESFIQSASQLSLFLLLL